MTWSELAVNVIIWLLTIAGGYFGLRAAWRRRLAVVRQPADAKGKRPDEP